ncbi:hypothetical protein D3C87_2090000 [compost metagenome]
MVLGMGDVKTRFAGHQQFPAHGRHGFEQRHGHAGIGQHFRCHQAGGSTANNRHLAHALSFQTGLADP